MVAHLASLSDRRLIVSFAPNTLAYSILKRIGELFPGPSKVGASACLHCVRLFIREVCVCEVVCVGRAACGGVEQRA